MKCVIIGGGIAGTTCAEELRKRDADAEITIIEQEPHRLYSKVLLSRYVTGALERERLFLKTQEWYEEKKIELMSGVRVLRIDAKNRFVETSDGREIPFDQLVIATGQEPKSFMQAEGRRGVAYLRNLDDAEALKSQIAELTTVPKASQRMIIMGGGFVATEFVHIAQALKIPATVVLRSDGFWSRTLSDASQALVLEKVRSFGIEVITNEQPEILGSDQFEGIRLANGREVQASILAVGTGIETDKGWLQESNIVVERGVVCDERLESQKDIYTVGDVAEFKDVIMGRAMHIGNWTNAIQQARCVAATLAGEACDYQFVSSYATRLGDLELTFIGDADRAGADEVRSMGAGEAWIDLFDRNGRTVGAVILGPAKERMNITKAIEEKRSYEFTTSVR